MSKKPYYETDGFKLIKGNSFKELKRGGKGCKRACDCKNSIGMG